VSSPSGAGKTTLTRQLLREFPVLQFSVSYTTRAIRPGEQHGVDYYFVDPATFDAMVERGEFAEHATVHGNRYGTAKAAVNEVLDKGRDVIFDVDWQGGRSLSAQWPDESLKVFILPPDLDTLAERLKRRATDAPEVIERRLRTAIKEVEHFDSYPFLIVNDDLARAYDRLRSIYLARQIRPDVPDEAARAHARSLVAATPATP
jgi:guanylate kinase